MVIRYTIEPLIIGRLINYLDKQLYQSVLYIHNPSYLKCVTYFIENASYSSYVSFCNTMANKPMKMQLQFFTT